MPQDDRLVTVKIEYFFTGLLITAFVAVAWFSVYVVYRLFEGQR
jgi:hypothetical protein